MSVLPKYEEPLGRLREAKKVLYRAVSSAESVVGRERGRSLRTRVDFVAEADPLSSSKQFRAAAVEIAALAHFHNWRRLRDDVMSVACHLRQAEESCHCGCGGKCGKAEKETSSATAPKLVYDVLRSPGEPLDATTRRLLQDYFDQDLGDVRIHSDGGAAAALKTIKAFAFAAGKHVVIEPTSVSTPAQGLLVHELIHVLQQRHGGRPTALRVQDSLPWECEAEEGARSFQRFLSVGARGFVPSLTPSETALQQQKFPAQCLDICPLRVASRFPPAPCLLTDCERLGFWPPVFARSWCTYICPGNWEGPEAAWLINTIFGTVGPHYTS
jgi:Domain of unknown function (DUF4157)